MQKGRSFVCWRFEWRLVKEVTGQLEDVGMTSVISNQGDSVIDGHMIHGAVVEEKPLQERLVQAIVASLGTKHQHGWTNLKGT